MLSALESGGGADRRGARRSAHGGQRRRKGVQRGALGGRRRSLLASTGLGEGSPPSALHRPRPREARTVGQGPGELPTSQADAAGGRRARRVHRGQAGCRNRARGARTPPSLRHRERGGCWSARGHRDHERRADPQRVGWRPAAGRSGRPQVPGLREGHGIRGRDGQRERERQGNRRAHLSRQAGAAGPPAATIPEASGKAPAGGTTTPRDTGTRVRTQRHADRRLRGARRRRRRAIGGTYFALSASSKRGEADDLCTLPGGKCPENKKSEIESLDEDAKGASTLSVAGFVVGGLGIATGVTLLLLAPKSESARVPAPRVTPGSGTRARAWSADFEANRPLPSRRAGSRRDSWYKCRSASGARPLHHACRGGVLATDRRSAASTGDTLQGRP